MRLGKKVAYLLCFLSLSNVYTYANVMDKGVYKSPVFSVVEGVSIVNKELVSENFNLLDKENDKTIVKDLDLYKSPVFSLKDTTSIVTQDHITSSSFTIGGLEDKTLVKDLDLYKSPVFSIKQSDDNVELDKLISNSFNLNSSEDKTLVKDLDLYKSPVFSIGNQDYQNELGALISNAFNINGSIDKVLVKDLLLYKSPVFSINQETENIASNIDYLVSDNLSYTELPTVQFYKNDKVLLEDTKAISIDKLNVYIDLNSLYETVDLSIKTIENNITQNKKSETTVGVDAKVINSPLSVTGKTGDVVEFITEITLSRGTVYRVTSPKMTIDNGYLVFNTETNYLGNRESLIIDFTVGQELEFSKYSLYGDTNTGRIVIAENISTSATLKETDDKGNKKYSYTWEIVDGLPKKFKIILKIIE